MRDIKFRIWSDKKMDYSPEIFTNWLNDNFIFDGYDEGKEPIVMQYTGLKDKNGKEIFEGDVVKLYSPREKGRNASDLVLEIAWKDIGFWGKYIREDNENVGNVMAGALSRISSGDYSDGKGRWYYLEKDHEDGVLNYAETFEIIGNIYENPELLS